MYKLQLIRPFDGGLVVLYALTLIVFLCDVMATKKKNDVWFFFQNVSMHLEHFLYLSNLGKRCKSWNWKNEVSIFENTYTIPNESLSKNSPRSLILWFSLIKKEQRVPLEELLIFLTFAIPFTFTVFVTTETRKILNSFLGIQIVATEACCMED